MFNHLLSDFSAVLETSADFDMARNDAASTEY